MKNLKDKFYLLIISVIFVSITFSCKDKNYSVTPKDDESEEKEISSKGSGGLEAGIHDTEINGHPAIIVVPQNYNPEKPTHLAFRLHGDGGDKTYEFYTYSVNSASSTINKFIEKKNWVLVSPRSPLDNYAWWGGMHLKNIEETKLQADHFRDVLEYMFEHYNLYYDKIYGCGLSGGAEFFTSQFVVWHGDNFNISMVLLSGGDWPWLSGSREKAEKIIIPKIAKNMNWTYVYGSNESKIMFDGIKRGINYFRNLGVNIDDVILNGAAHHNQWVQQGFLHPSEQIVKYWEELSK